MFCDEKIRANDSRHFILECRRTLQREQLSRLSIIKTAGNPLGLFAFKAFAVEQIDRPIKLKQDASKGIDIGGKFRPESKWIWRNAPIMAREEAFRRHLAANQARAFGGTDVRLGGLCDH